MKPKHETNKYQLRIPKDRIIKLLEGIITGMPITAACERARISKVLVQKYIHDYENYCEKIVDGDTSCKESMIEIPVNNKDEIEYDKLTTLTLGAAIENAKAEAMYELITSIRLSSRDDSWQKYAWLLERRYRDTFGKEIELKTNSTSKVESQAITVSFVNPEEDKDRLARLELETKEAIGDVVG